MSGDKTLPKMVWFWWGEGWGGGGGVGPVSQRRYAHVCSSGSSSVALLGI